LSFDKRNRGAVPNSETDKVTRETAQIDIDMTSNIQPRRDNELVFEPARYADERIATSESTPTDEGISEFTNLMGTLDSAIPLAQGILSLPSLLRIPNHNPKAPRAMHTIVVVNGNAGAATTSITSRTVHDTSFLGHGNERTNRDGARSVGLSRVSNQVPTRRHRRVL
jgi:hypothetical protein